MGNNSDGKQRAWAWASALSGAVPPLITPTDSTGHVDAGAMDALVNYTLAGGCSALFVAGGCGLGPWLTVEQRGEAVRAAVRSAAGRVPVLAGVMLPATGPTCEAARQAEAEGADAVVVATPYYFAVQDADSRRHLEAVLRAVTLPALIYNIPQCTHHVWQVETVAALAAETRILGEKDSSGDLPAFQRLVAIKRRHPNFRLLQGDERVMGLCLLLGGDGVIAGLANVAPRLISDLVVAGRSGDIGACRALQEKTTDLLALFGYGQGLAGLYAACSLLGVGSGQPIAPWAAPDEEHLRSIAAVLDRHHLLPPVPVV